MTKLESIMILSETFNSKMSETLVKIYLKILEEYADEQIEKAIISIIKNNVYNCLPKPAEIIKQIEGSQEDKAMQAWVTVLKTIIHVGNYKSVEFGDSAIHQTIDAMGGWQAVAVHNVEETPFIEKRFLNLYRTFSQRQMNERPKLLGFHDITNKTYIPVIINYNSEKLLESN